VAGGSRAQRPTADEGFALVALLVTFVLVVPLALGALAIVVRRQKDVVYERSRTFTAHVAEAGLDGGLVVLRAASAGGRGQPSRLPCADPAPLLGPVTAERPGLRYAVLIRYYLTDPAGTSDAWRQANALACTPGAGPAKVPSYALLQSAATGSQTLGSFAALRERSVEAVYRFNIDNQNVAGGLVHTRTQNVTGVPDMCWATAGAVPSPGAGLVLTTCREADARELLSYRADLSIYSPAGDVCLTTSGLVGAQPTFEACTGGTSQRWVYTSDDHLRPVTGGGQVAGTCIGIENPYVDGGRLVISSSCWYGVNMWSPDAHVGPGGAGAAQYQLVNFEQFGRCFDVTDIQWDNTFMQLHPCKQAVGALDWPYQQLLYEPATRRFRFGNPGNQTTRCLTSPPGASSEYVTTSTCSSSRQQVWTVTGDTGVWDTGFTILDADGRCLSKGPVPPEPSRTFAAVIVAPCDGSAAQKWNAPGDYVHAGLEAFRETTGGS
jgi:hypothetical protein